MRITKRLRIAALLALPLLLAACHTTKHVDSPSLTDGRPQPAELIKRVEAQTHKKCNTLSAKLKFNATVGGKEVSVAGSLRMKRDDVIRIQLVPLGLVEAARIEFTPDYALFIDRLNKQYVKAPYQDIEFLSNSGINFNMLQSLFTAELFQPGKTRLGNDDMKAFVASQLGGRQTVVSYSRDGSAQPATGLAYSWLIDELAARVERTDVVYYDQEHGNTQLGWEYREVKTIEEATVPTDMLLTLQSPRKEMKVTLKLSNLSTDGNWENRTTVSSKYRQAGIDDIIGRLANL